MPTDKRQASLLLAAAAIVDVRTSALAVEHGPNAIRRTLARNRVIAAARELGISLPLASEPAAVCSTPKPAA